MTRPAAASWQPPAPFPDSGYADVADRLAAVLGSTDDVVLVQAEAVVALEAAARGLGAPGVRVLNLVSGPYGPALGAWFGESGAEVVDLRADPGRALRVDEVARVLEGLALEGRRVDVVAIVHGEAATGVLNPVDEIAPLVRRHGALLVVDAVASVGGHPVTADQWSADLVVGGPQKALDGPASLSFASVSARAWAALDAAHRARSGGDAPSILSLRQQHRDWIARGRGALPGSPDPLAFRALRDALDRLDAEGRDARIARHRAASARARAGLAHGRAARRGVTVSPADPGEASWLVTAVRLPDDVDRDALLTGLARAGAASGTAWSAAVGDGTERMLRLGHAGFRADPLAIDSALAALDAALAAAG